MNRRQQSNTDRDQLPVSRKGSVNISEQIPLDDQLDGGVSGLAVYADPDRELAYFYLPLAVVPQQQSDGKPMVNLFAFDDGGYFHFNAQWRSSDEQLVALRGHLAAILELEQPDLLQLAFAPVSHVQLKLFLSQDESEPVLLGSSSSTGAPPYSSLFNLKLDKPQFERVKQMLTGKTGLISIQLESSWAELLEVRGQLQGGLSMQRVSDIDLADKAALRAFLLDKIDAGELSLQIEADLAPDSHEYKLLIENVINQAIDVLQTMRLDADPGQRVFTLSVEYLNRMPLQRPVSIVTDLADWFVSPEN